MKKIRFRSRYVIIFLSILLLILLNVRVYQYQHGTDKLPWFMVAYDNVLFKINPNNQRIGVRLYYHYMSVGETDVAFDICSKLSKHGSCYALFLAFSNFFGRNYTYSLKTVKLLDEYKGKCPWMKFLLAQIYLGLISIDSPKAGNFVNKEKGMSILKKLSKDNFKEATFLIKSYKPGKIYVMKKVPKKMGAYIHHSSNYKRVRYYKRARMNNGTSNP